MRSLYTLFIVGFAYQPAKSIQILKNQEQDLSSSLSQTESSSQALNQQLMAEIGQLKCLLAESGSETKQMEPKTVTITHFLEPQTVNILPGVFHLQKGFNAYKGKPLYEGAQSDKDVFKFTFDQKKGTSGDTSYLVPDQMDIPPLSYQCIYSNRASEVTTGNSVEFMEASEKSVSHEASISGGYSGGFSVNVEAAYKNTSSAARKASKAARETNNVKQIQTSAIASLYTFALRSGDELTFLSESFQDDLAKIGSWPQTYEFISTYGTHYLKKAKLGARYQENIYFSLDTSEEEISETKSKASGNAFSLSVEGSGAGAEAAVSTSVDMQSSSTQSNSRSSQNSESVSKGGIRQFGQIAASGTCGDLLGDENILFPIEYETEPLWKLVDAKKYPKARSYLEHFLRYLNTRGEECAKAECSSRGACVVDDAFFTKGWKGLKYQEIFKKDECVCKADWTGHRCKDPFDAANALEEKEKADKILAWTFFKTNDPALRQEWINWMGFRDATIMQFFSTAEDWLIFTHGNYKRGWKAGISRFGTQLVAVNKEEAYNSKVVIKPDNFKKVNDVSEEFYIPVCRAGYAAVSSLISVKHNLKNTYLARYKENSVHCLNRDYIIRAAEAKGKYRMRGWQKNEFDNWRVYPHRSYPTNQVGPTSSYYCYNPHPFKFDSKYARFNLGVDGATYYPAQVRRGRGPNDHIIDFGNESFFFTEEPRKTLADMKS